MNQEEIKKELFFPRLDALCDFCGKALYERNKWNSICQGIQRDPVTGEYTIERFHIQCQVKRIWYE